VLIGNSFHRLNFEAVNDLRNVTGLAFAPDGALWVNGVGGVLRIDRGQLDPAAIVAGRTVQARLFDFLDGLQGLPQAVVGLGSAWMGADARLYIARREFVQAIDPLHLPHNDIPPTVWIKGVSADGQHEMYPQAPMTFKANVNTVEIDYTATSLLIPERVRFRYKLDGYDQSWIDAGTRRQAFYSKLPPGSYSFKVLASNDSGVWNNSGAQLRFVVPPTFTQTRWFTALCILIGMAVVWLLFRLRVAALSRQIKARMYARLAERERIARDLHDTFFQGIQGLLLSIHTATKKMRSDDPIRPQFEDALRKSDQVMAEGRELVLELRTHDRSSEELGSLFDKVAAEAAGESTAKYSVITHGEPRPLRPAVADELYWLGREALSNAFRHSGANAIEVELTYGSRELRVRFRDDGVGIDEETLSRGKRENHSGMPGMRERGGKIGARLDIWSAPGAGTEIDIRLPASLAYQQSVTLARFRWGRLSFGRSK
jgi:signal transduction histidine kinase